LGAGRVGLRTCRGGCGGLLSDRLLCGGGRGLNGRAVRGAGRRLLWHLCRRWHRCRRRHGWLRRRGLLRRCGCRCGRRASSRRLTLRRLRWLRRPRGRLRQVHRGPGLGLRFRGSYLGVATLLGLRLGGGGLLGHRPGGRGLGRRLGSRGLLGRRLGSGGALGGSAVRRRAHGLVRRPGGRAVDRCRVRGVAHQACSSGQASRSRQVRPDGSTSGNTAPQRNRSVRNR
jgi:hypothetical protein